MKKYKVLRVVNGELISPYQNYNYGKLEDVLGKKMVCEDFDDDIKKECAARFYATDVDGLVYSLNENKDNRVFEVEMGGRSVINSEYKQGFEEQIIIKMLTDSEVKKLIKEESDKMDWDYYHACYPVNPLKLNKPFDKEKSLKLLKEWASVWVSVWASVLYSVKASVSDSVWYSVWDSVWYSVRYSVGDSVWYSVNASIWVSVWDSVKASVRDFIYAYISSFFPNIKKWEGIEHKKGVNPFQSGVDLWHMGLVPSFDGEVWRLHKGEKAEVVLEITGKELRGVKE
jgi:hypothetical protein